MVINVLKEQGGIVFVFAKLEDLESPLILGLIEKIDEYVMIGSSDPERCSLHINGLENITRIIVDYFSACEEDVSLEGPFAYLFVIAER